MTLKDQPWAVCPRQWAVDGRLWLIVKNPRLILLKACLRRKAMANPRWINPSKCLQSFLVTFTRKVFRVHHTHLGRQIFDLGTIEWRIWSRKIYLVNGSVKKRIQVHSTFTIVSNFEIYVTMKTCRNNKNVKSIKFLIYNSFHTNLLT